MAFRKLKRQEEKIELVSLIDMIFILLVFFLVTSYVIKLPLQERSVYIPTPENVLGRAQIMIQIIHDDRFFWLDENAANVVEQIESDYGYFSEKKLQDQVLSALMNRNMMDYSQMAEKIALLKERANADPNVKYFVLIRCPNEIPYAVILEVISELTDTRFRNIQYGCVAGSLRDIQNASQITTIYETDEQGGRRKNIRITF